MPLLLYIIYGRIEQLVKEHIIGLRSIQNHQSSKMLYQRLASLICLGASLASAAVLAPEQFSCGSENPPESLVQYLRTLPKDESAGVGSRARPLSIDTYFHVVSTGAKNGSVPDRQLSQQVRYALSVLLFLSFPLISPDMVVLCQ